LTLFGFADADEREVFETVQTVSGIGPRLALAMLAVHTPDGLRAAVAGSDLTALMRVPGIGRKGAQRLVLELTDRLGPPTTVSASAEGQSGALPVDRSQAWRDQVLDALVGLGWQARAAGEAVDAVVGDHGSPGDGGPGSPDVTVVLRAALRHLGRVA
jgi:Holliday junction DNA helicase RuvA